MNIKLYRSNRGKIGNRSAKHEKGEPSSTFFRDRGLIREASPTPTTCWKTSFHMKTTVPDPSSTVATIGDSSARSEMETRLWSMHFVQQ